MVDEFPYQVSWSRKAIEALKELGKKVREFGRGKELVQTVRAMDERLRRDPLGFGEVCRMRGVVAEHLAVSGFVSVDFAVDQQRKLVLVRDCHLLSGYGL